MKQYRVAMQIDLFIEAESLEEANAIWGETNVFLRDKDGKDLDHHFVDCEIIED